VKEFTPSIISLPLNRANYRTSKFILPKIFPKNSVAPNNCIAEKKE
jgi:hypothetical protein